MLLFWIGMGVVLGCSPLPSTPTAPEASPVPTQTVVLLQTTPTALAIPAGPSPTPSLTVTATAGRVTRVWIDPRLPQALSVGVLPLAAGRLVQREMEADLRFTFADRDSPQDSLVRWTYVLAARFASLDETVSLGTLKQLWLGGEAEGRHLLLDQETKAVFAVLWGLPQAVRVTVLDREKLLDAAWKDPLAWVILPFEALEPRWKVLKVDGFSVFERGMDEGGYPLSFVAGLTPGKESPALTGVLKLPLPNREPYRIVSLMMTGTTALVRKTAQLMNDRGILYPAKDLGSLLREADLTHLSNEVSFNQDCPPARAASLEGIFCSAPEYLQLLEAVGVDIVELTGNHNLDKGEDAYRFTLSEYQKRGWMVYGGGLTLEEGQKPLLVERGETRLAFLGCNMAGPEQAWASKERPGAAVCDIERLEALVRQLRAKGYLVVVTFQAFETEDYMPAPMQRPSDFVHMADAGAVIVSGSQAHFPQGFGFSSGNFIHYGLGNLFFDQVEPITIRRSWIDRHLFYGGKYLGVEPTPIMLEDFGRPRLMTAAERKTFLGDVFSAEGWQ